MPLTRRAFVTTGLAGAAGFLAHGTARALETPWQAPGEDGGRLWLRYAPPGPAADAYRLAIRQVIVQSNSPTAQIIRNELRTGLSSLLGTPMAVSQQSVGEYALVAGSPQRSGAIQRLGWNAELDALGDEGFIIRSTRVADRPLLAIASRTETGALYGAFHLLRLLQTGQPIDRLDLSERPKLQLRLLNHWDNLNGTIERGYAGNALWQWNELPGTLSPRYAEYARANASIGINGTVINNVNADVRILSAEYLLKVAALAGVLRPYGVRMYLSANVAAPIRLGGLATADPLDQGVAAWWKTKAAEIYKLIPDFGGFLVKANSEGQPGPKDYGRTHAEGANVLAEALSPHGGRVIWRAFIYDDDVDADRSKRAYLEFMKLDGQFRPNVVVQVKNGPIDFQPREPFHPLFGAMKQYAGHRRDSGHAGVPGSGTTPRVPRADVGGVPPADTHAKGKGSTVGRCLDGSVEPYSVTGMASVANPGLDTNWCGHHFSQANWYASGRLAWNPSLPAARIAEEWTRMTFTNDAAVGVISRSDDGLARGVRELHDATRPPSPDRRQPLRADAAERQGAARRLDRHVLSPGVGGWDRLRPDVAGLERRRPVLSASARHVRAPRDVPGRVPPLVSSLPMGLQDEIGQDALDGPLREVRGGCAASGGDADHLGVAPPPCRRAPPRGSRRPSGDPGRRRDQVARRDPGLFSRFQ